MLQSEWSSALYPEHYACEASRHRSKRAMRRGACRCQRSPRRGFEGGYLWGRKDVAILTGAVTGLTMESASNITKHG